MLHLKNQIIDGANRKKLAATATAEAAADCICYRAVKCAQTSGARLVDVIRVIF